MGLKITILKEREIFFQKNNVYPKTITITPESYYKFLYEDRHILMEISRDKNTVFGMEISIDANINKDFILE